MGAAPLAEKRPSASVLAWELIAEAQHLQCLAFQMAPYLIGTGMAIVAPDYETCHARFPLSNFPPEEKGQMNRYASFNLTHLMPAVMLPRHQQKKIAVSALRGDHMAAPRSRSGISPDRSRPRDADADQGRRSGTGLWDAWIAPACEVPIS
jgi:hypothetical protein